MDTLPASFDFSQPGRSSDITAADKIFDNLEKNGASGFPKLTHEGRQWLEVALDPFHDRALEVSGQPSYDQQNSIVQVVKRTMTFTAPTSNGDRLPFDMHIAHFPVDVSSPALSVAGPSETLRDVQRIGNNYLPSAPRVTSTGTIGTLTVATVPRPVASGGGPSKHFPDELGPAPGPVTYTGLSPTQTYWETGGVLTPENNFSNGLHRCIAAGFEVIVTTPVLYRGGLLTAYRQARKSQQSYGNVFDGNGAIDTVVAPYCDVILERGPPATADAAMLLPDTRQWDASLGAYVVLTQNGWDNEFQQPMSALRVYDGADVRTASDRMPRPFTALCSVARGQGPGVYSGSAPYFSATSTPFSVKGVILERLHPESVITVNLRWITERVPTLSEPDLVVLARPSPAYDELAWRFYSEAARRMPVAVQLSENFTGGWFKAAAKTLGGAVRSAAPVVRQVAPLLGPKAVLAEQLISAIERGQKGSRAKAGHKKKGPTPQSGRKKRGKK